MIRAGVLVIRGDIGGLQATIVLNVFGLQPVAFIVSSVLIKRQHDLMTFNDPS